MKSDEFGTELAKLRQATGLSLRELARQADLSPASLSAIEKGTSSPTLATLHKILKALGTDFAAFFSDSKPAEASPVFRAGEGRTIQDANRQYTLLFPKREDLRFEIVRETIASRESSPEWESHDFDLGGVILEGGPMRLEIEGVGEWVLETGDGFYIKAGQKHRGTNLSGGAVKLMTVADPPKY